MNYIKDGAHICMPMCALLLLAGCGGGGGGGNTTPPASVPTVSIADQYVLEPTSSTSSYPISLNLSAAAATVVTVAYSSADSSATAAQDYTFTAGTVTFLAGETSKTIPVSILSDATGERDEVFTLTLSSASGATIARSTATITIVDRVPINDTGITTCGDASSNQLACPQTLFPGQDAEVGRDISSPASTDGRAGFEFTKLDAAGGALAANAASWSCVRDEVTGLVWEIKPDDISNLRHRSHTYAWYNSDSSRNGGGAGAQTGGICAGGISCNTAAYVQAVNAAGLCGSNGWRLPTTQDLISIRDYGSASPPSLDTAYFPDFGSGYTYWASEPYASDPTGKARVVSYTSGAGAASSADKSSFFAHIRLVH